MRSKESCKETLTLLQHLRKSTCDLNRPNHNQFNVECGKTRELIEKIAKECLNAHYKIENSNF